MDLVSFIAGEVLLSFPLLVAQIKSLPEGARYVAVRAADVDEQADDIVLSPREQKIIDARVWNLDRRLWAMQVNATNTNTAALGQWQKGKEPKFPIVGPANWDPARMKRAEAHEKVATGNWSNWDLFSALGG